VADAFHQAAVTQKSVGEVVHDVVVYAVFLAVELLRQQFFRQRHAHGIGNALTQRARGGFHARSHAHLRVAGSFAV